ncbi:Gpi16 subunit, GPI transamidase component [Trichuris suis]|nr:Gpi16 subunit, GPI transamidase component [Trichuris suis]
MSFSLCRSVRPTSVKTMLFIFIISIIVPSVCSPEESYNESLHIAPLSSDHLLAYFSFHTISSAHKNHFNLMPNAFGRILQEYHVTKLQLSLTQGLWRQRLWSYYSPIVPMGASIYALFENDTARSIDHKWRGLVHSLSGLFCASFSQIDSSHTVSPMYKLHKDGHVSSSFEWENSRYAVLPSENVCTENLTPWKKLLPCKTDAGGREDFELQQTVTIVLDNDKKESNMFTLFGSSMKEPCAIATSSVVLLMMPRKTDVRVKKIHASALYKDHFVAFDSSEWAKRTDHTIPAGSAAMDKLPVTILTRSEANAEITALFRHIIPWFIRIYFHTLRFLCHGITENRMGKVHYQAARDRSLSHYLEVPLLLPPGGNCSLMINFDKSLLHWTEYPSDANYGFRLPAASVEFYVPLETERFRSVLGSFNLTSPTSDSLEPLRIFGEHILVYMPTPDFSMPYNVLCLVYILENEEAIIVYKRKRFSPVMYVVPYTVEVECISQRDCYRS